jgi:peptide/nickel transport system substrate-binding protein
LAIAAAAIVAVAGAVSATHLTKPAEARTAGGGTTFVGTPRDQTLIVDNIDGRIATAGNFNPYLPGTDIGGDGVHALVWSPLWEINTTKGTQFPDLAAKPIKALNKNDTRFRIDLRKGVYWSDGVEFTADDVLYTANMLLTHPKIPAAAWFKGLVARVKPIDKFALEIDTKAPQAHLQRQIGTYIWDNNFRIMPAHIWKTKNPMTYNNNPVIGTGPYTLDKYDPQGNWFLWKLRPDWKRSDVGVITGKKPGPQYVLVQFYGTEQQRIVAMSQHKLDVLMPISPNGWSYLQKHDSSASAWYPYFPYGDEDDPANRSIYFNDTKAPYNQWQVRWALALAINVPQTTLAYNGMLRAAILPFSSTAIAEKQIYGPLQSWLKSFALPDGYKPYDPNYASQAYALLRKQGVKDLPRGANLKKLFGPGAWKYDPKEATKLLESVGFKLSGGKWHLPDGKTWSITVNAPANFEPESGKQGCAVADQWKQFGIDTTCQGMDSASFWANFWTGKFDAGAYWNVAFLTADSSDQLQQFNPSLVVPTGTPSSGTSGNPSRWKNPAVASLLRQMAKNPAESPKNIALERQFMKLFVKDLPFIPMFASTQLVPTDDYYWTNFPTAENPYNGPWWWWSNFKFILPNIKSTGK